MEKKILEEYYNDDIETHYRDVSNKYQILFCKYLKNENENEGNFIEDDYMSNTDEESLFESDEEDNNDIYDYDDDYIEMEEEDYDW